MLIGTGQTVLAESRSKFRGTCELPQQRSLPASGAGRRRRSRTTRLHGSKETNAPLLDPFEDDATACHGACFYRVGKAYAVKTKWVVDLYQQGKLDTPLAAAGVYKCLTPQLEAMVNRSSAYINKQLRRDFKKVHAEALQAKVLPYRTLGPDVEAIAAWQEQYSIAQFRYYCNSIKFI